MDEFPDVVELSVQGQTRTTLLSLLTKDDDSVLAAMFTGRQPVYKDEKGRYFIDANPFIFDYILKYLKNGDLPDFQANSTGFGFGGGGGLFGRPLLTSENDIRTLYKEASYFRIKGLVEALEIYKPILIEKRLETYRKSRRSYEESLNLILSAITGEEILYGQNMIVQLRQETQTAEEPKCCSHNCIDDSSRSFGQTQHVWETDVVVSIPSQLDVPLFKMLYTDIQNLGYNIQGRLAICHFRCSKRSKKSCQGFSGFGYHPDIYCCMEKMFLIQFVLGSSTPDSFTQHRHAKQGGGLFGGGPAQNAGGLFGAGQAQASGFSFGAGPGQDTGFGTQTTQAPGFGMAAQANNATKSVFGSSPQQQQQQNKNQSDGLSFGSAPTFGSASNSSSGQQKPVGGGLFGSPSSAQNQAFGGFGSTTGSTPGQKSPFGQPTFGQSASPQNQTSSGFGQSAFGQSSATQNQGTSAFGGGVSVGSGFFTNKTSSFGTSPTTTAATTTDSLGGFNFNASTAETTSFGQQSAGFSFVNSTSEEK